MSTERWLGLGLVVALLGVAALSVATLALAREVGMLRLRIGPAADSALEIPAEGPPLGARIELDRGVWGADGDGGVDSSSGRLRLAVFLSDGCHICHALEPQVRAFARDPMIEARLFDEAIDAGAWQDFAVPGSPYAVALASDGLVLAKGSFNTVAQLESVLAAAERRQGGDADSDD